MILPSHLFTRTFAAWLRLSGRGADLSHLPCPYRQAVTRFTEELDYLSATDREWIMGRAIAEWLNWPRPQ